MHSKHVDIGDEQTKQALDTFLEKRNETTEAPETHASERLWIDHKQRLVGVKERQTRKLQEREAEMLEFQVRGKTDIQLKQMIRLAGYKEKLPKTVEELQAIAKKLLKDNGGTVKSDRDWHDKHVSRLHTDEMRRRQEKMKRLEQERLQKEVQEAAQAQAKAA